LNSTLLLPLLLLVPAQDQDQRQVDSYWGQVAEALSQERSVAQVLELDPATAQLIDTLESTRIASLQIQDEESLAAITSALSAMTGLPIVADSAAELAVLDEGVRFDLNWSHPATVSDTLDVLAELSNNVIDWTVRGDAVLVTLPEHAYEPTIFLHPMADLTAVFEPEVMANLILDTVSSDSWDYNGVSLDITGAFLTVVHDRKVQLAIEAFLTDLREFVASLDGPPDFSPIAPQPQADHHRLASIRLTPAFEKTPLADVAAFLQEVTGFNVLVSPQVFKEFNEAETSITLHVPETDAHSLLDLIVSVRPSLSWSVADGLLRFHTAHESQPDVQLALYDVRAIVNPAPEAFPLPANFTSGDEVYEALVLSPDHLGDLVRNAIAHKSWDMDPANSMFTSEYGISVVSQSPRAQAEIRKFLADLQGIAEVMLEVQGR
jgi:hypothetical protein